MGRRTKLLNKDKRDKLLKYIEDGNYISVACHAVGIHPNTYCNWVRLAEEYAANPDNGNEYKKIYFDFCEELKRIEAQAEANIISDVRKSGKMPQYWAAGMTMLERKHKDRWGRQDTPIVESKVLIALQDRFASLRESPKVIEGEVKQLDDGTT